MLDLQSLLIEELREIFHAEKNVIKAYPRLTQASSSPELKKALTDHVELTKHHITRLEQIFAMLGERVRPRPSLGMRALIEAAMDESNEEYSEEEPELDCKLIAAAQKIEHYEIAAYGTVRVLAKLAGAHEAAELLTKSLRDESAMDKLLSGIAMEIYSEIKSKAEESDLSEATTFEIRYDDSVPLALVEEYILELCRQNVLREQQISQVGQRKGRSAESVIRGSGASVKSE